MFDLSKLESFQFKTILEIMIHTLNLLLRIPKEEKHNLKGRTNVTYVCWVPMSSSEFGLQIVQFSKRQLKSFATTILSTQ